MVEVGRKAFELPSAAEKVAWADWLKVGKSKQPQPHSPVLLRGPAGRTVFCT